MRVVQIFDKPPGGGGIRRHVEMTSDYLAAAGHEVVWLRVGADGDLPPSFAPGSRTRTIAAARRALAEHPADVALVHAGFTSLAGASLDAIAATLPTLGVLHDVAPFCPTMTRRLPRGDSPCVARAGLACFAGGCVTPSPRAIARVAIRHLNWRAWTRLPRLLAPSAFIADLAVLHGAMPERVATVPHAVPSAPAATGEDVLFVGSVSRAKGIDLLVAALREMLDMRWHLRVAGDGPDRAMVTEGLPSDRVTMLGQVGGEELAAAYAAAAVLVFPSRLPESFGLVGVEAMARGLPVLGFGVGGSREWLIDGETGLRAPEETPLALAAALRRLLADAPLRSRLGERARLLHAERFTPALWASRMSSLLAATAGARRAPDGAAA